MLLNLVGVLLLGLVSADVPCPYNCSGRGNCRTDRGTCSCNTNWTGPYCSFPKIQLPYTQPISGAVSLGTWVYYSFVLNSPASALEVDVVWTNMLYPLVFVSRDTTPSWAAYDFCNIEAKPPNKKVLVRRPAAGTWTIGVTTLPTVDGEVAYFNISWTRIQLCPNNCSGVQGVCQSDGTCACVGAFQPPDCSQSVTQLPTVATHLQDVPGWSQRFLYYCTPPFTPKQFSATDMLTVQLDITLANKRAIQATPIPSSQYVLFASKNKLPTLSNYDQTLSTPGDLYIYYSSDADHYCFGVWGGSSEYPTPFMFNLTINIQSACPNNCTDHGTCVKGNCSCDTPWTGPDCSIFSAQLTGSAPAGGDIEAGQWNFYYTKVTQKDFVWTFQPNTIKNYTVGLYLKFGSAPSAISYDNHITCLPPATDCVISMNDVQQGVWYFGIWLMVGEADMIHYWVLVNIQDQCPNECTSPSHFYQCTNAICECYPGWTHNADCSVYIKEYNASQYPDGYISVTDVPTLGAGEWHYFRFEIGIITTYFTISLTLRDPTQPVDMYLREDVYPTEYEYYSKTLMDTPNNLTSEQINIGVWLAMDPVIWVLGVRGPETTMVGLGYSFVVDFGSICSEDNCSCPVGKIGTDCQFAIHPLDLRQTIEDHVSASNWVFYDFAISSKREGREVPVVIVVTEKPNRNFNHLGLISLYVLQDDIPTELNYRYSESSLSQVHKIFIPSNVSDGSWTLGVRASPFLINASVAFTATVLTGCEAYSSCGLCLADPACGWCQSVWKVLDDDQVVTQTPKETGVSSVSVCLPLSPQVDRSDRCPHWLTGSCLPDPDAPRQGRIVGSLLGSAIIVVGLVIIAILYQKNQQSLKKEQPKPNPYISQYSNKKFENFKPIDRDYWSDQNGYIEPSVDDMDHPEPFVAPNTDSNDNVQSDDSRYHNSNYTSYRSFSFGSSDESD